MPKMLLDGMQRKRIDDFLNGYKLNRRLLGIEKYYDEYFKRESDYLYSVDSDMLKEAPLARAKMFEVRHFILGLPNSDEKLLLYYHYIKGDSVERCAELLGISRRNCFRLKQKALALAYDELITKYNSESAAV